MRVLIVDDSVPVCNAIKEHLVEAGMMVDVAYDCDDATAKYEIGKYEVIIIDILIPPHKKGGLLYAKRIRDTDSEQRIFIITGTDLDEYDFPAEGIGEERIFTKPNINYQSIISAIANVQGCDIKRFKSIEKVLSDHGQRFDLLSQKNDNLTDAVGDLVEKVNENEKAIDDIKEQQTEFISKSWKSVTAICCTVLLTSAGGFFALWKVNSHSDMKLQKFMAEYIDVRLPVTVEKAIANAVRRKEISGGIGGLRETEQPIRTVKETYRHIQDSVHGVRVSPRRYAHSHYQNSTTVYIPD